MSDNKRVDLRTLEPQKVQDNPTKRYSRTVRIRVKLPESNEDKCPEFNYKDELAAAKKKLKQQQNGKESNNIPNGLDPFGEENDDDVRRIALEMEAKYGAGDGGTRKKRRGRKDDYADIGAGYDESDSFIDNTDGYDEIIPHNVTTARGGFYINSGALEFKTDEEVSSEVVSSSSSSSEEESDSEDGTKSPEKANRKRALDTTDEEDENSNKQEKLATKPSEKPNISMQQAIKKKLFSTDKIQIKKRKLAEEQLQKNTVKELLREKRTESSTNNSSDKDTSKENKKPMKLSSVDDAIESVIGKIENPLVRIDEPKHQELSLAEIDGNNSKEDYVKLPKNLPADILEIIEKIKQAAQNYKDGGKVKFFSGNVNILLLNLERKCKVLGRSSRVRVYDHLAPFVRCRKETLIKRAKNLVFEGEQQKLKKTIDSLRVQIDQLMPALIMNYEKECQRIMQRKFSQEAAENEELKNLSMPRRRFSLHEEMKRMLRDIVNSKKRCFIHEGKSKSSLENLLFEYLKKEILILWPEGWMSMTVLKKFCIPLALKTPEPKLVEKASSSGALGNYGNNLTITPVNLSDKLAEIVSTNNSSRDTIVQTVIVPEKIKNKDNGVIVLNSKIDEPAVINKKPTATAATTHCQIIDLTDSTNLENKQNSKEFEKALKTKFPGLSVTTTQQQNDPDDVQKVMESLKALQQLSSPSKSEISNPAVSVIAFNKNYSNSSSQNSGAGNERTNFSGAVGYQDEFQKQFIGSLNNKSASMPSKSGFNNFS